MLFTFGSALLLGTTVSFAAMQTVQVGQGGLQFSPSTVTAASGDTVQFTFDGDHSVTQSSFADPCKASGFSSGVMASGTYTVTVNDTNPIWIFCSVPGHCQTGMVMAINAPTTGQTFAAFQDAAEGKAVSSTSSMAMSSTAATASMSNIASASGSASASTSGGQPLGVNGKLYAVSVAFSIVAFMLVTC
ncbi:hypothetical protein P7C73_g1073, partial [Tremellales sp. Uapishka_1]